MISIFILATVLFELINLVFLFSLAIAENSIFHFFLIFLFPDFIIFHVWKVWLKDSCNKMAPKRVSSAQKAAQFEQQFFGNVNFQTELGDLLLSLYSWGKNTSNHCSASGPKQLWMTAIDVFGECRIQEWQVLAKLGDYGARVNNISRDLSVKFPDNIVSIDTSHHPAQGGQEQRYDSNSYVPSAVSVAWRQLENYQPEWCLQHSWPLPTYSLGGSLVDGILLLLHHPVKKVQNFRHTGSSMRPTRGRG